LKNCVFCGGSPLTREHVWPQWMRKFSGPATFIERHGAYQGPTKRNVLRQDKNGEYVEVNELRGNRTPNLHEVQVKCVCASCNNGWMAVMETSVARHLRPMAALEPRTLSPTTKSLLAAWSYKSFLMYDQHLPSDDRIFTAQDLRGFKKLKTPPWNSRIYMGWSDSPLATIAMWHEPQLLCDPHLDPQEALAQPRNLATSYLAVQGIYFIQQYFKADVPWTPMSRKHIDLRSRIGIESTPAQPIWPATKTALQWPPKRSSHAQLEQARLSLFEAMSELPVLARRVDSIDNA